MVGLFGVGDGPVVAGFRRGLGMLVLGFRAEVGDVMQSRSSKILMGSIRRSVKNTLLSCTCESQQQWRITVNTEVKSTVKSQYIQFTVEPNHHPQRNAHTKRRKSINTSKNKDKKRPTSRPTLTTQSHSLRPSCHFLTRHPVPHLSRTNLARKPQP